MPVTVGLLRKYVTVPLQESVSISTLCATLNNQEDAISYFE